MAELIILAGYLLALLVVSLLADYVVPHIKPLERWIENCLPDGEDEDC